MRQMLAVLDSGFKVVGRAFRTFELVSNHLVEQYALKDDKFPDQVPTPPVDILYEGFDNVGKTVTAFGNTMSGISDVHWERSAKHQVKDWSDESEDEEWVRANVPRVPDPVLPVEMLERGFRTLHKAFDVFESAMGKQSQVEKGEVGKAPAEENDDGRSLPPAIRTPPSIEKSGRSDAQGREEKNKETQVAAKLPDAGKSRPLTGAEASSKQHTFRILDPVRAEMSSPPSKRRAISAEQPYTARASPLHPYEVDQPISLPVRSHEYPKLGLDRPLNHRRSTASNPGQDRLLSVASQGETSAPIQGRKILPDKPVRSQSQRQATAAFGPARPLSLRYPNPCHAEGKTVASQGETSAPIQRPIALPDKPIRSQSQRQATAAFEPTRPLSLRNPNPSHAEGKTDTWFPNNGRFPNEGRFLNNGRS